MLKKQVKSAIIIIDLRKVNSATLIFNNTEEMIMIDNKNYILVEGNGYANKSEAYDTIRLCYSTLKGVTTYYDNGLWYIVQSKALM